MPCLFTYLVDHSNDHLSKNKFLKPLFPLDQKSQSYLHVYIKHHKTYGLQNGIYFTIGILYISILLKYMKVETIHAEPNFTSGDGHKVFFNIPNVSPWTNPAAHSNDYFHIYELRLMPVK